jgi:hypothetical protein
MKAGVLLTGSVVGTMEGKGRKYFETLSVLTESDTPKVWPDEFRRPTMHESNRRLSRS